MVLPLSPDLNAVNNLVENFDAKEENPFEI